MKLNKEICKRCWNNNWDKSDDDLWWQGTVYCRCILPNSFAKLTSINEAKDECPYKLEHLVLKETNETK